MVQRIMNEYVDDKNLYRTRRNDHSHLPTKVPADVAYYCPETYGGERGLVPIPDKTIKAMMDTFYPDCEELFEYCDHDFKKLVEMIAAEENIELDQLDLVSVSVSFDTISTVLEDLGVKVLGSAYTTDE